MEYFKLMFLASVYMAIKLVILTPIDAWGTERVGSAIYMNANSLGMVCAASMIMALYFAQSHKLYYIFACAMAVISLFSGSRKAFFMIMAGFLIFWVGKNKGLKAVSNLITSTTNTTGTTNEIDYCSAEIKTILIQLINHSDDMTFDVKEGLLHMEFIFGLCVEM